MTTTEPDAEAIEVEVVDDEHAPSVEIERAAAPLSMPPPSPMGELSTIPHQGELRTLAQLATTFAFSKLVPESLQGKPEDCLLVLLTARDLGLSVTVAFRECHPIDGRVTVSPKLKLAIVRQRGLGRIWPDPANDVTRHTWFAARADDPQTVYQVTYTLRDAERAGLWMAGCSPDDHSEQCQKGAQYGASREARKKSCKQNWRTYPGQMLQWRCMGYLMDQAFGEVGVGLYSADELGAVTDEDGHVIDIMEAGPLDGMPDHTPTPRDPATDPNAVAPEDFRDQCKERIYRLPDPAIATLREQWSRRDAQTGIPTLFPLPALPLRQVKAAAAIIAGFEARAERGEWGPWNPPPLSWEITPDATEADPKGGRSAEEPESAPVEPAPSSEPQGEPGPEATPDLAEPGVESVPDAPPYDPKHPPSEVLEAAIDGAKAIADDQLDAELAAQGQTVIATHKPDTKRRRIVQGWFVAGWVPDSWEPSE